MTHRIVLAAGFAALAAAPAPVRAQVLTEHDVSVEMAMVIAQTAMEACTKRVSVAVVDRVGRMRVFLQGDGAQPSNIELARRKAYTALTFGRTSIEWAERAKVATPGQLMLTDVMTQQGGVPIKYGDETIGAVGLSGAPNGGQQEEDCGKAGIAKVADQLKK
jgi:uncharacterized protein GlcG (DUF336 family)